MFTGDVAATVVCLSLAVGLLFLRGGKRSELRGYVLGNDVTHARLLPKETSHSFTYFTLSFLVSLKALESHSLDIGRGWIFGYGGLFGRLVGLRPDPYLEARPGLSIQSKLRRVLDVRGYNDTIEDYWMLTMPSYLGFEGINPLTVYFCYKPGGILSLMVLEIHNTFSEAHVHVLEVNDMAAAQASIGYDYDWTFARDFHVSPFNDRFGFYTISIRKPNCAPGQGALSKPYPVVRVHQHTGAPEDPTKVGPLKLTALLRPTQAAELTSSNLLSALARAPFTLLLSMARIYYNAYILHYKKRLDVFIKPDPVGVYEDQNDAKAVSGGVRWQEEGRLERKTRRRVEDFLAVRAPECNVHVTLVPPNSLLHSREFGEESSTDKLVIEYLSPRFFVVLFTEPSAEHALSLSEGTFSASSPDLFRKVFSCSESGSQSFSYPQQLRKSELPPSVSLPVPSKHFLDEGTIFPPILLLNILWMGKVERFVFDLVKARPVVGDEPWRLWEKAELSKDRPWVGSVVRRQ